MIIIDRTKSDWCQQCKFVNYYDWYICNNENVDLKLLDKNGYIKDKNVWKRCKLFKEEK